ncbi:Chemotaxis protein CheA [Sphingomonas haloaromaticamans]|uniref:Chemotaxis protein CheA n=1 Tax=Edaphosphingomonas haloaromaticamans TaxID=653954 RepID=A0A1S1HLR8_9SPHN|nr:MULTISPECIES: chemotaxis protein CheA [Sphingomonas]OHT21480.1 Chemotaxis protein CheA [Sphingomonas haloaromaticamans]
MSAGDDGLDEIQAIFFEECAEGLAIAEEGLSAMANGDVSADVIAGVFRAVHSIKGGSGAFGHAALLAFSHRFENVLDEVRAGRIAPTPAVTKVMLGAFDILSDHVAAAQGNSDAPADEAMLEALDAILKGEGAAAEGGTADPAPAPAVEDSAPVAEADEFGFVPVAAGVEDFDPFGFEPVAIDLEDLSPAEPQPWTVRFGPSRAALANGSEPLFIVRELETMGGRIVAVDSSALPGLRDLDPEDSYLVWTIELPGTVDEQDIRECFDFVSPDSVIDIARAAAEAAPVAEVAVEAAVADAPPSPAAPIAPAAVAAAPAATPAPRPAATGEARAAAEPASQTIRVDLSKLDQLLNLVGELVIHGSILSDRLSPADQERVELPELSRLTRQIQDNVMSLRAQPIRQAFSRVPRMLRDLMAETGKKVVLETSGETTEVDKGVLEKIGDPLTHMIRNAVDHGIESPEERIAAGKPAEGTIHLSAEQKGARIIVRVADDGRGINRERVRAKAVEKGIISADAQLSDEEIDSLICAPGFSTAETISNISGRGVGMDVVRSNVEALGGRVEIHSTPGEGTTFIMALPLTLAILDGMIVRLGQQRFVLPLTNVIETVQPEPGQVKPTSPNSEVIELRGSYLPVKRVGQIFGIGANDRRSPEESLVIIVESEAAGHVGLMVDTIENRREVVIKSLEDNLHPIRGLGGATILGDGTIGLILDIDALVASTNHQSKYAMKGMAA